MVTTATTGILEEETITISNKEIFIVKVVTLEQQYYIPIQAIIIGTTKSTSWDFQYHMGTAGGLLLYLFGGLAAGSFLTTLQQLGHFGHQQESVMT